MKKWTDRIRDRLKSQRPVDWRASESLPRSPLLALEDWKLQDGELKEWSERGLSPAARDWLFAGGDCGDRVRELGPQIFELEGFFDPLWLSRFVQEIERIRRWVSQENVQFRPPNSMHYGGFELAPVGLGGLINQLSSELMTPLARRLYPDRDWPVLEDGHGFLAEYGPGADRDLSLHVDDSDITMTLCLGDQFEGSEVVFEGLRCPLHQQTPHSSEEVLSVMPVPGRALVHLGAHRHRVSPLLSGNRQSLILWSRGLQSQDERMGIGVTECPDWCEA